MKRIPYWQLFGTILLIMTDEILTPIIREIQSRTYSNTYNLLFMIIIYILGGIIISLPIIKGKIRFSINYKYLVILFILLIGIVVEFHFMFLGFYSIIILKLLSLLVGFFFLRCFIQYDSQVKKQ